MGWWIWVLLLGFVIIAAVIIAQMFSGDWIGKAVKEGIEKCDRY